MAEVFLCSSYLRVWENLLRMKRFSQRKELKPVAVIQTDSMNSELRNSLWNVFYMKIMSSAIYPFSQALWLHFFKEPIDSRPANYHNILGKIRSRFFNYEWFEVYDFLEFFVECYKEDEPDLAKSLNSILEQELSGYRFVSGRLTDITNDQEIEMLETALEDSRFAGVDAHLKQALNLYAKRDDPDYRNSIKESISAVEKMARIVSEKPKATLSDALKRWRRRDCYISH